MTLSFQNAAFIKQYLPGLYFIVISAWIGFENQNLWMGLIVLAFILQLVLNNRYLNLILGGMMILWSAYMGFTMVQIAEATFKIITVLLITVVNLYMARMLFLNQNFAISSLRENSLDEILFL